MGVINPKTLNDLRKGNHKAFEEVFFAYFDKIKYFIFGYIKSEMDAEELTEVIFVNLWMNHRSIDISKSFNSYMHTIARNAALNFLKHKFVKESHKRTITGHFFEFDSEEKWIAKETQLLIEMAVEKMPKQRKTIFQLSRNEGLKNSEIATRLNTSKSNVESQLSLALKDLKRLISTAFLFSFF